MYTRSLVAAPSLSRPSPRRRSRGLRRAVALAAFAAPSLSRPSPRRRSRGLRRAVALAAFAAPSLSRPSPRRRSRGLRRAVALAALASLAAPPAHAQLVADLAADWSDTNNSNTAAFGTWSYRQGTLLLPHVANWTLLGASPPQPAWVPGTNPGNYLPAEFKATSDQGGWLTGDVVIHTTDPFNGVGEGTGNFLWTSPIDGTITISGDAFEALVTPGRLNAWSLAINGITVSSGNLIPGDGYVRSNPFLFSNGSGGVGVLTQNVTIGSTIDLLLTDIGGTSGGGGNFVGVNLHLVGATVAPVPEPGGIALLVGIVVTGAGFVHKRRNRF